MANEFTSTNDKGLRTHELQPSLLAEASFPWYFRPPNTRKKKASASMEAIIHNSHKSVFVPSLLVYIWNDQPLPLKSQMFVSIAWGKGRRGMAHAKPSGSWAMFCFWSERQLNNIGHAYFYLMGVAFYTYSSFQPGRLQWTNFVSWGRNILHCFWKKAVKFRSPGTNFFFYQK